MAHCLSLDSITLSARAARRALGRVAQQCSTAAEPEHTAKRGHFGHSVRLDAHGHIELGLGLGLELGYRVRVRVRVRVGLGWVG